MVANWSDEKVAAFRKNIFEPAWAAIPEPASAFSWHRHADLPKSSQALAIDVFGTIQANSGRDAIMAAIAREVGMPDDGPWQVAPEWHDASNSLSERVVTQVDAAAVGRSAIILFECKFTEDGGGCSQTMPDEKKRVPCSGSYAMQTNPQNGVAARCALTGKGIRYWDHIPAVYGIDAGADLGPCPFRFDAYQWMRNVVLAKSLAALHRKETRVVAAYADAPFLKTAVKVRKSSLGVMPINAADAIVPMSYQRLIDIAESAAPGSVWSDLRNWVDRKIEGQRGA